MGVERKTALDGFRLLALFVGGESWRAAEVEAEMGWSKAKAYGMLLSAVQAGYVGRTGAGDEVRYRLSAGFRDSLARGLNRAALNDAAELAKVRAEETCRAVRTQMDHLVNELREVLA